jgi:hypothetical protein
MRKITREQSDRQCLGRSIRDILTKYPFLKNTTNLLIVKVTIKDGKTSYGVVVGRIKPNHINNQRKGTRILFMNYAGVSFTYNQVPYKLISKYDVVLHD